MRKGYTTGTCAQAAAKAAAIMLTTKKTVKRVEVRTPNGTRLDLKVVGQKMGRDFAEAGVVKDAGDDVDVTDGAVICARARHCAAKGISLRGGKGVGIVTKPGLAVAVGERAINPVPREMIIKEVTEVMRYTLTANRKERSEAKPPRRGPLTAFNRGVEITISVPKGKELAKRTFNPRLGIVGGISIIGTTGIVEPKSTDAYKRSLSVELDLLKAAGHERAVLVLGYVGERFCKETPGLKPDSIIKIGDHVGFMLRECVKKNIRNVLLVGHIGKLVKVANGQFDTNILFGDGRLETIGRCARLCGAEDEIVEEISRQRSAEAAAGILIRDGLETVFDMIAKEVVKKIDGLTGGRLSAGCIVLSLQGEMLASYPKGPAPCTLHPRPKLHVIGAGPGAIDYLIPAAKIEIERADCLIGARRILSQFNYPGKRKILLEGDFKKASSYIKRNKDKERISVLVSGDPGLYSFMRHVKSILKKEEYEVIPGISALQVAFARIGESWQDAKIVSLHGRDKRDLAGDVRGCSKVFFFTDAEFPPDKIAGYLLRSGVGNRRAVVFENLTYPDERIVDTDLEKLSTIRQKLRVDTEPVEVSGKRGSGLCAMVVMA